MLHKRLQNINTKAVIVSNNKIKKYNTSIHKNIYRFKNLLYNIHIKNNRKAKICLILIENLYTLS